MSHDHHLVRRVGRRSIVALSLVTSVMFALVSSLTPAPAVAVPQASGGLQVVENTRKGPNEIRLKVFSSALNREEPVTLLLPEGYDDGESFPVLYALGGKEETNDRSWASRTDLPAFTASRGALVVLPSSGKGFFSDWRVGHPNWETYHTKELPALIRSKFKGSDRQAVMGISLGGFAAIKYAAHNPGRYAAAASFSGVLVSSTPGMATLYQRLMKESGHNPDDIWGDPTAQRAKWRYEDPSENLGGLRGTRLYVSSARGLPKADGSWGDPTTGQRLRGLRSAPTRELKRVSQSTTYESIAYDTTTVFERKATAQGVSVKGEYPTLGVHDWGAWNVQYKAAWSKVIAPSLGLPG